jgi:hypothetical protein
MVYSFPAEVKRDELECPECGREPCKAAGDQVAAVLDENDPGVEKFSKAVLNDGTRQPI